MVPATGSAPSPDDSVRSGSAGTPAEWSEPGAVAAGTDAVFGVIAGRIDPWVVASGMAEQIASRVPAIAAAVDQRPSRNDLEACCAANITAVLQLLRRRDQMDQPPAMPDEARAFTLDMVHRRVPKEALLRGYRIGHGHLWGVLMEHLAAEPHANLAVADAIAALLFAFIDGTSEAHADLYEREHDAWVRSASAVRLQTVSDILAERPIGPDEAARRLTYDLRGRHVAMVVRAEPGATGEAVADALTAQALAILDVTGATGRLLIPATPYELWVWASIAPGETGMQLDRLERAPVSPGLQVAVGRPRDGIDGFRVSHDEALRAVSFCRGDSRTPLPYRQVEVVALLTTDEVRCKRFVQAELGPLASVADGTDHLRNTVLAYLDAGGSHMAAAEALFLHKNTVYTRVQRAKTVLGREIEPGDRVLHAALALAHAVPEIVLAAGDERRD